MVEINNLIVKISGFIKNYENLYVPKGAVLMITGDNGSGKTILLNAICGLISFKNGSILLNKTNAKNDTWKEFTSCFLDRNFLIPYLTASEYFELCLLLSKKEIKNSKDIEKFSKKMLFDDFNKKIKNLSLGNQKKVGLISTLITNPEIIIWDEPFANLDKKSSTNLNELLIELSASGKTVLYTNNPDQKTYYSEIYDLTKDEK
jgi:ABC-2 type transport system ATP-binding protein